MNAQIKNICAMLIFGSIGVFIRHIPLPSSAVSMFRALIGTAVIMLVCAFLHRRIDVHSIRSNLLLLAVSGAAIGANWICLFEAYKYTTVAVATLSYYLAPAIVIAVSPFILKEKMTVVRLACVLSSIFGMALVVGVTGGEGGLFGIFLGLCAAVLYAGVIIMNKFLRDIGDVETTLSQLAVAFAVTLPYVLVTEDVTGFSLDLRTAALVLTVGVVHTGVSYLIYFSSMKRLSAQTIAIFSYLDPVTAVLLSAVLLREKITVWQILGAALILGSTLLSEVWTSKRNMA